MPRRRDNKERESHVPGHVSATVKCRCQSIGTCKPNIFHCQIGQKSKVHTQSHTHTHTHTHKPTTPHLFCVNVGTKFDQNKQTKAS